MENYNEEIKTLVINERFGIGHHRVLCPCAEFRKAANRREKTLSIDVEFKKTIWSCHHCGSGGALKPASEPASNSPSGAQKKLRLRKAPDDQARDWLLARGISTEAIERCGVKFVEWRDSPAVGYAYYHEGKQYAAKIRSINEKKFAWDGNAVNAYLWHLVDFTKDFLYICEGECDALSLVTAGFENVISVPHGAPNSGSDKGEYRFAFMAENAAKFAGFKRIILCGDQDPRGNDLSIELSRRLGRHRCYELKLPEGQKDCNETLMFSGVAALRKAVNDARPFDIPGMAPASAFRENVYRLYNGEIGSRMSTGIPCLDKIYQIVPGMFTVWTGHPGSGKSLLLDYLNMSLARREGIKIGAWSAEVPGHIHVSKLAETLSGKRFHSGMKNRMDEEELEQALAFIDDHMFFMTQDEPPTTESLIERATAMVMRYGIKSLILDPFNYISFPGAKREDLEISDMLSAWLTWAKTYEVWTNMVAHPRNLQPEDIPNGNHIAGGAMFKAKADFGMTVHREGNTNSVICWKAKHDHIGKLGSVELGYDSARCNFYDPDSEEGRIERASRRRPQNDYDDPEED